MYCMVVSYRQVAFVCVDLMCTELGRRCKGER